MDIVVKIECDTIAEFYSHLTELRKQIKKETKRLKLDPGHDEFPAGRNKTELDDNNCYGTHEVFIKKSK